MYMPWSRNSLERATQLIRCLSMLHERLQIGSRVSLQEMVQAKQQLDELQALAEVPGVSQVHQKYRALLSPYWQSYGFAYQPIEYNLTLHPSQQH